MHGKKVVLLVSSGGGALEGLLCASSSILVDEKLVREVSRVGRENWGSRAETPCQA
jgi:hypothetical protein